MYHQSVSPSMYRSLPGKSCIDCYWHSLLTHRNTRRCCNVHLSRTSRNTPKPDYIHQRMWHKIHHNYGPVSMLCRTTGRLNRSSRPDIVHQRMKTIRTPYALLTGNLHFSNYTHRSTPGMSHSLLLFHRIANTQSCKPCIRCLPERHCLSRNTRRCCNVHLSCSSHN